MAILLGPILHLERQMDATTWRFSIHVMTDEDAAAGPTDVTCRFTQAAVTVGPPTLVASFPDQGRCVWSFLVEAPRGPAQQSLSYAVTFGGESKSIDGVAVPGRAKLPRMVFFSCNGFSSAALMRQTSEPNALWVRMREAHERGLEAPTPDAPSGIHVLIGGGDQVYADSLGLFEELDRLSSKELRRLRSSAARRTKALREYLDLYASRWSQTDVAEMFARVPVVFTWDDHDIFDGWGSHGPEIQQSEAYLDVFDSAKAAFRALQLGGDPTGRAPSLLEPAGNRQDGHFMQSVRLHGGDEFIDILLPDARSGRTPERVFSDEQWGSIRAYLAAAEAPVQAARKHLLVVSSIPLVYLRFRAVGWILRNLVPGVQEIEDDLLDQWEHPAHLGERARVLLSLLRHQKESQCRVTMLSGDVHAGALGRVESLRADHRDPASPEPARITQITSSGIVHPSPSSWQRTALELLGAEGRDEVTASVTTTLIPIDSETERLWNRNFLLLDVDGSDATVPWQLWARFVAEGRNSPRVVTVPPL